MRVVKLLKLELQIICETDLEDYYVEDIVQLALDEELNKHHEQPIKYVRISTKESHPSVLVEDDYSLVTS